MYLPACNAEHVQEVALLADIPGLILEEFSGTLVRIKLPCFQMTPYGSVQPVIRARNAARVEFQ